MFRPWRSCIIDAWNKKRRSCLLSRQRPDRFRRFSGLPIPWLMTITFDKNHASYCIKDWVGVTATEVKKYDLKFRIIQWWEDGYSFYLTSHIAISKTVNTWWQFQNQSDIKPLIIWEIIQIHFIKNFRILFSSQWSHKVFPEVIPGHKEYP